MIYQLQASDPIKIDWQKWELQKRLLAIGKSQWPLNHRGIRLCNKQMRPKTTIN